MIVIRYDCVQAGRGLLLAALNHLKEAPAAAEAASRVAVLLNPADAAAEPSFLSKLLIATTQLTSRRSKISGEHSGCCVVLCAVLFCCAVLCCARQCMFAAVRHVLLELCT